MGQYRGTVEWRDSIYIVDEHTKVLGGDPEWSNDEGVAGFANISAAQLTNRTNYLKAEINKLTYEVKQALGTFMQGDNNLSELTDPAQARYRLGLNLVDNTRDIDKPISNYQRVEFNKKVDKSTKVIAGDGLDGGGALIEDVTISLSDKTKDSIIKAENSLQKDSNLSDIDSVEEARDNLGLGSAALADVVDNISDVGGEGKVVVQGWMGLGSNNQDNRLMNDNSVATKIAAFSSNNMPTEWGGYEYGSIITTFHGYDGDCADIVVPHTVEAELAFRNSRNREWNYVYHTGNFDPLEKQDKLEAGENITIEGNKISATVGDSLSSMEVEEMRLGESESLRAMTAKNISEYSEFVGVTGSTITIDFSKGRNFQQTVSGNRTIAKPVNMKSGITGDIVLYSSSADRTLTFDSVWKFPEGEAPTVKGGTRTVISYKVVDDNTIICSFSEGLK